MKIIIVGMGIQGKKRFAFAGKDAVATVDIASPNVDYKRVEDVPLRNFDAALLCLPDEAKIPIIEYLLKNKKHVLVEKPLISKNPAQLQRLKRLAEKNKVVCYTAYNHRFEPHIVTLKKMIDSGKLGRIYLAKFFYGNGTARDVRNSLWRDKGMGVLPDLGSHLLDWTLFLFGKPKNSPRIWRDARFENRAYDHFHFGFPGKPELDFEMTLLSWRNTFRADIFAENGSVHIDSLCKWGPTTLTYRKRILPSGRPTEESETLVCPDPTWQAEYAHFKKLCQHPSNNIENDLWINATLLKIERM
ncbi:MAG: Gfo/Idh/MocA family protein [Verrucomicrobiota bacterium]